MELPTRNEGWQVRQVVIHAGSGRREYAADCPAYFGAGPQQREIAQGIDLARYNNGMIKRRADKTVAELIEELNDSPGRSVRNSRSATAIAISICRGTIPLSGDVTGFMVCLW